MAEIMNDDRGHYLGTVEYTVTQAVERMIWPDDPEDEPYMTVRDETYDVAIDLFQTDAGTYVGYDALGLIWGPYKTLEELQRDHAPSFARAGWPPPKSANCGISEGAA